MCLSNARKIEITEPLIVYKFKFKGRYVSYVRKFRLKFGRNNIKNIVPVIGNVIEEGFFHSFADKEDALMFLNGYSKWRIIKCLIPVDCEIYVGGYNFMDKISYASTSIIKSKFVYKKGDGFFKEV
jgi:hypothetical protein